MKKVLFILFCSLFLYAYPVTVWSQETPSQDAGASTPSQDAGASTPSQDAGQGVAPAGQESDGSDVTNFMREITNTDSQYASRDSLTKTNELITRLHAADQDINLRLEPAIRLGHTIDHYLIYD